MALELSKLDYRELDLPTADDKDLIPLYEFRTLMTQERDPDEPALPLDLWLQLAREKDKKRINYNIVVFLQHGDDLKVIATAGYGYVTPKAPNYEDDKHIIGIGIQVLPECRGNGIGTKLLSMMVEKTKELPHVTKIFGGAYREEGIKFLEKYGGKVSQTGAENRLRIDDVDWEMIKQWENAGEKLGREEGVTIEFFEDCPEDIIKEYTQIYTETMNQQPLGDYDGKIIITPETRREEEEKNKTRKLAWYTMITREKDGTISGLTEMFYHPATGHKGYQNLTGVKEEYRGRGLGKWLKAKMLLWYYDRYPNVKYISTGNADSNAPMLSINKRMGFKTFVSNTGYSFVAEELYKQFDS